MKVKISYTVNVEEVPNLVQGILSSCQQELNTLSGRKLNTFETESLINEVISIRESLAAIDTRLEDSVNIIAGYHNSKLAPAVIHQADQEEEVTDEE